MKYSKTYLLLLSLHYYFTSESTPDGWTFHPDDGGFWISDSDPDESLDAFAAHFKYDDEYIEVVERPILVGDKGLLLTYSQEFAYRHPEGYRIIEINSISSIPEASDAH